MELLGVVHTQYRTTKVYHQNIMDLDVSGCPKIGGLSVSWIAASCPSLERLNLSYCSAIDDTGLVMLKSLYRLKFINLMGCHGISDG